MRLVEVNHYLWLGPAVKFLTLLKSWQLLAARAEGTQQRRALRADAGVVAFAL